MALALARAGMLCAGGGGSSSAGGGASGSFLKVSPILFNCFSSAALILLRVRYTTWCFLYISSRLLSLQVKCTREGMKIHYNDGIWVAHGGRDTSSLTTHPWQSVCRLTLLSRSSDKMKRNIVEWGCHPFSENFQYYEEACSLRSVETLVFAWLNTEFSHAVCEEMPLSEELLLRLRSCCSVRILIFALTTFTYWLLSMKKLHVCMRGNHRTSCRFTYRLAILDIDISRVSVGDQQNAKILAVMTPRRLEMRSKEALHATFWKTLPNEIGNSSLTFCAFSGRS